MATKSAVEAAESHVEPSAAQVVAEALAEHQRRLEAVAEADARVAEAIAVRDELALGADQVLREAAAEILGRAHQLADEVENAYAAARDEVLAGNLPAAHDLWGKAVHLRQTNKATAERELRPALRALPGHEGAHLGVQWPAGPGPNEGRRGGVGESYDQWLARVITGDQRERRQGELRAAFAASRS